ncbi:MAG: hypothetical protein EBS05_26150, partial [Proteobacteria bacterium]|nr:hypothetical protein [Pseudomonadota bacterium]
RKIRASKLDHFAEQLREWDEQRVPISCIKPDADTMFKRLTDLGCDTSVSRICRFLKNMRAADLRERLLDQITTAAQSCKEAEGRFRKAQPPGLNTLVKLHRVIIMQLATQSDTDPELIRLASGAMKPVLDYAKLELRHKEFGLQQRKFALLKARAAKADQAEQVANSDLTPEEKQRKMREIFGLV